jgi:hypothetical protein
VGEFEGNLEGEAEGRKVGTLVGCWVGLAVGNRVVGLMVGAAEGADVGSLVRFFLPTTGYNNNKSTPTRMIVRRMLGALLYVRALDLW